MTLLKGHSTQRTQRQTLQEGAVPSPRLRGRGNSGAGIWVSLLGGGAELAQTSSGLEAIACQRPLKLPAAGALTISPKFLAFQGASRGAEGDMSYTRIWKDFLCVCVCVCVRVCERPGEGRGCHTSESAFTPL